MYDSIVHIAQLMDTHSSKLWVKTNTKYCMMLMRNPCTHYIIMCITSPSTETVKAQNLRRLCISSFYVAIKHVHNPYTNKGNHCSLGPHDIGGIV